MYYDTINGYIFINSVFSDFILESEFLLIVTEAFKQSMEDEATQMAIIFYAGQKQFEAQDYTYNNKDCRDFIKGQAKYDTGQTWTHQALNQAKTFMDGPKSRQTNPEIRKIIFLLTDGKATDEDELRKSVQNVQSLDPIIWAIGVSPSVDKTELDLIASDADLSRLYKDMAEFRKDVNDMLYDMCRLEVQTDSPNPSGNAPSANGKFCIQKLKVGETRYYTSPIQPGQLGSTKFRTFE